MGSREKIIDTANKMAEIGGTILDVAFNVGHVIVIAGSNLSVAF